MKTAGKSYRKGRFFYRILFPFIAITSAAAILLSLFFYRQYEIRYRQSISQTGNDQIEGVSQSFGALTRQMRQIYDAIAVEGDITDFLALQEEDSQAGYHAYTALNRIIMTNSDIYLAALCNGWSGQVLLCGSDTLPTDRAMQLLKDRQAPFLYTEELTERDSGTSVLVFAYPYYPYSVTENPCGVFLAVREDDVLQAGMPGISDSQACVVTENDGSVLLQKNAEEFGVSADFLAQMQDTHPEESQCTFTFTDGDARYICSRMTDSDSGRRFTLVTSEDEMLAPLRKSRNAMILFFGMILLAAAVVQYVVTRRIYAPIRKITNEVAGRSGAGSDNADEFALIQNAYAGILEEMRDLEQKSSRYAMREKSDLCRELILDGENAEKTAAVMAEKGYALSFDSMFLIDVAFSPKQGSGIFTPVVVAGIQKLLTDSLSADFVPNSVQVSDTEVAELLNVRDGSSVTFDDLLQRLGTVKGAILAQWPVVLCIGIDGGINSPRECALVYRRVRDMMQNRFTLGDNALIDRRKIADLVDEPMEYPDKIMSEIAKDMILRQEEKFRADLESFREVVVQYSYQAADLIYIRLLVRVLSDLEEKGIRIRQESFSDNLFAASTLDEGLKLLRKLYDITGEQLGKMENLRSSRQYEAVRSGEEYIRAHYMDSRLSTEEIASQLGYTASYYARIFKTVNGNYLGDYLRQVRVMKAKDLLQNSAMTVQEISEAAGFTTANYFYTVFKKETGLTPAAYRTGSQNGREEEKKESDPVPQRSE